VLHKPAPFVNQYFERFLNMTEFFPCLMFEFWRGAAMWSQRAGFSQKTRDQRG
jgi:hypothetical protein